MRLRFVDGLRVLATGAVFVFHCAHVFDGLRFHVSNRESALPYLLFVTLTIMWIMPLFFLLAGVSAGQSLDKRGPGTFLRERFLRLGVPYLAGIILLIPPQKYVDWVSHRLFRGSFLEFLPFMIRNGSRNFLTPDIFGSWGHHLWFLAFLLLFSILLIPLSRLLKSGRGELIRDKVVGLLSRPGLSRLAVLPLMVYYPLVKPLAPGYGDWADFGFMFLFFVTGYLAGATRGFWDRIRREWGINLAVGLTCFGVLLFYLVRYGTFWFDYPGYTWLSLSGYALWALGSWSLVFFFCGIGQLLFKKELPVRLVQGTMPFYLIHQTAILLLAFFIVRWNLNLHLKFLVLVVSSLAVTVLLSEGLVSRFPATRVLFGMPARAAARRREAAIIPASGEVPNG